jgi:DNA-binding MarR family transcriptional regulator
MVRQKKRDPVDEVLLDAIRWAMAVSVRAADAVGDLSPVQLRALTFLHASPRVNLNDMALAMGVTVSTTSRLVDRLVAAGLVDRSPSAQSRREISLTITATGRRRLQRYDRRRLAEARARLAELPAAEQDTLLAALTKLSAGAPPEPGED